MSLSPSRNWPPEWRAPHHFGPRHPIGRGPMHVHQPPPCPPHQEFGGHCLKPTCCPRLTPPQPESSSVTSLEPADGGTRHRHTGPNLSPKTCFGEG